MNSLQRDRELITGLGGPVKVAETLKLGRYGAQRVSNWNSRGIPAAVKVKHPELFMPELSPAPAQHAAIATECVAGQGA